MNVGVEAAGAPVVGRSRKRAGVHVPLAPGVEVCLNEGLAPRL